MDVRPFRTSPAYRAFTGASVRAMAASGPVPTRDGLVVVAMDAHPRLPLYLTAGVDGRVLLWHFGWPSALAQFGTNAEAVLSKGAGGPALFAPVDGGGPGNGLAQRAASGGAANAPSSPSPPPPPPPSGVRSRSTPTAQQSTPASGVRVKRVRFDVTGSRVAALLSNGQLLLYSFVCQAGAVQQPYEVLQCHKAAHDLCFVADGRVVTAGDVSRDGDNVRVWDPLLPASEALVGAYKCGASPATALCTLPGRGMVAVGTQKGSLHVVSLDAHGRALVDLEGVHAGRVYSARYDRMTNTFVTGGQDGVVRRWDAVTLEQRGAPAALFEKRSFFNHPSCSDMVSSFGVTDVAVTDRYVLVAGSSGAVKYLQRK